MATPRAKARPAAPAAVEAAPEPVREPVRPERPLIPGRAVALNRAGVPVQRAGAQTGVDSFFIPPHLPPPGWSWEWKRETVYGQTDSFYLSQLHQVGWEHVMYEQYPGVFAPEYDDKGQRTVGPVRRHGLMLMERSEVLTKEAQADERRKADERVNGAKHQYNRLNTDGTATAEIDHEARKASYIRESVEAVHIPPGGGNPARQSVD